MAGNPIFYEDVINVSKFEAEITKLIESFGKLKAVVKESAIEVSKSNDTVSVQISKLTELKKENTALTDAEKQAVALKKQLTTEGAKWATEIDKETKLAKAHDDALKNQGRTYNEVQQKIKALTADMKNMDYGSAKQKEAIDTLQKLNTQLKETDAQMNQHQKNVGNYGSAIDKLKGVWMGAVAAIAAAAGVIKFATDAFKSNEAGMDRWNILMEQSKESYQVLLTTIRNGDWSNFLTNIRAAIKEGERYQDVLNELEKKTRAVDVSGAATLAKIAEYKQYSRSGIQGGNELTDAGKEAYAKAAIALAEGMRDDKKRIAEEDLANEMEHLKGVTKLNDDEITTYVAKYGKEGQLNEANLKRNQEVTKKIKELTIESKGVEEKGIFTIKPSVIDETKLNAYIATLTEGEKKIYNITKEMEEKGLDPAYVDKTAKAMENLSGVTTEYWESTTRLQTTVAKLNKSQDAANEASAKKATELGNKRLEDAKKVAEQEAKAYDDYIKGSVDGELWMNDEIEKSRKERIRLDDNYYKIKVESGIATQDEIFAYEMKKQMEAVEFSKMTAQQQAVAIKYITKNALKSSEKGAIPEDAEPAAYKNPVTMDMVTKTLSETGTSKEVYNEKLQQLNKYADSVNKVYGQITSLVKQAEQEQMDAFNTKYDSEYAALDQSYKNKQITEEQYNQKKDALDKKKAAEQLKLEKETKKKEQSMSIIQALINTAVGVTADLSKGGAGWAMAVVTALLGAIEIAAISSQKFAKGGYAEVTTGKMLQGRRHDQGGVSLGALGTAESGEWAGIINRQATQKYGGLLPEVFDSINSMRFEKAFAPINVVNVDSRYQREMLGEMKKPKAETLTFQKDGKTYIVKGLQTTILT